MNNSNILPDLPTEIRINVDDLLRKAGEARRAGDFAGREKYALLAWDQLPTPKLGWNYYSNILPRNNTEFFRDTQQFEKALEWLEITRQSYKSTPENPDSDVEFIAATVYFEMGDTDRAFEIFDWQFKIWKKRPFEGKDRKYLDFYLGRKGK